MKVAIGQFTPPMAVNLMVSCRIARVRMEETVPLGRLDAGVDVRWCWCCVVAFPQLALWLPRLLGY